MPEPFSTHTGQVLPMDRINVDTDQIIPKQFLKRIERTGFGQFLFNDWRFQKDGSPNPDFVLNKQAYRNAKILIAGRNFGCGSSRKPAWRRWFGCWRWWGQRMSAPMHSGVRSAGHAWRRGLAPRRHGPAYSAVWFWRRWPVLPSQRFLALAQLFDRYLPRLA